jgi:hypothetical protein
MKKVIIIFIAASFIIPSCKEDTVTTPVFTGYSYAPDNIGHEIIYDVDSIIKSDFDGLTHVNHYQIRELIADTFTDNQGRPTLRLERYKRLTPSDPWIIYKVWTANKTNVHYEKKEDNVTYVKLAFPPSANVTWNGNSLNTFEQRDYGYSSFNSPESFNGLNFDSALTVMQYEYGDFLDSVRNEEKYATNVGMFYKLEDSSYYHTDFNNSQYDSVVFQRLYTEKIVSFSN